MVLKLIAKVYILGTQTDFQVVVYCPFDRTSQLLSAKLHDNGVTGLALKNGETIFPIVGTPRNCDRIYQAHNMVEDLQPYGNFGSTDRLNAEEFFEFLEVRVTFQFLHPR